MSYYSSKKTGDLKKIIELPVPILKDCIKVITVNNDIKNSKYGFAQEVIARKSSQDGDILVPVYREFGTGVAEVEWETKINRQLLTGTLVFDETTTCQNIRIPKDLADQHVLCLLEEEERSSHESPSRP